MSEVQPTKKQKIIGLPQFIKDRNLEGITGLLRDPEELAKLSEPEELRVLHLAVSEDFSEGLRLLLRVPAFVSHLNSRLDGSETGPTMLLLACENQTKTIPELLLSFESLDPNLQGEGGYTAVAHAVEHADLDLVNLLLQDKRVNPNLQDDDGRTIAFMACEAGKISLVELLLSYPAVDFRLPTESGWTPFWALCYMGRLRLVRQLIQSDRVDVTASSLQGCSPLHACCGLNRFVKYRPELVRLLLQDGRIDPTTEGVFCGSPLRLACANGLFEIVEVLLLDPRVKIDFQFEPNEFDGTVMCLLEEYQENPKLFVKRRCLKPLKE